MVNEEYGKKMRDTYGDDIEKLLIEQLQSDEESTDSEIGMTEKNLRLRVMVPHWRTNEVYKMSVFLLIECILNQFIFRLVVPLSISMSMISF